MLVAWIRGLAKSDNECLGDLFDQLLDEQARAAAEEQVDSHDAPMQAVDTLKVRFLANFMRKASILTFALASDNESDIVAELVERILQELASVHAYLDCWRASGGFTDLFGIKAVAEALRENVADVVLPWPVIDSRLVKSFPVEFLMGQGDLHQPRLRSDFSAADYVQHKFRCFDGRFLNSARGRALFNTALRE